MHLIKRKIAAPLLNEEEKTALLHIPAILVVWWRTACHIGKFTNRMGVWVRSDFTLLHTPTVHHNNSLKEYINVMSA
jgi:hypothetical protein